MADLAGASTTEARLEGYLQRSTVPTDKHRRGPGCIIGQPGHTMSLSDDPDFPKASRLGERIAFADGRRAALLACRDPIKFLVMSGNRPDKERLRRNKCFSPASGRASGDEPCICPRECGTWYYEE